MSEAFALGIATNLVSDLMAAGARRLRDSAVGDEQQRVIEAVFREATSAMIVELAGSRFGGESRNESALLEDQFGRFFRDPEVAETLLDVALERRPPPLDKLRERFLELGFDPDTFLVSFDRAMQVLAFHLTEGLREAARAGTSVHDLVEMNELEAMRRMLQELLGQRGAAGSDMYGSAGSRRTVSLLSDEVERLSNAVSEMVGERLGRARSAFREGRSQEALEWLRREKNNEARWNALTPQLRAQVLRFEAGIELDARGDVGRAKRLAQEARSEAPLEDDTRLRALIAYRESGPEAAIELLEGKSDVESLNFRAGLILETTREDRAVECRAVLTFEGADIEPDADTFRLRALSYLLEKDLDRARLEIQKAVQRGPRWIGVRFTRAVIDYFESLSPAAVPHTLPPAWPEPVDWYLSRRDDESVARLRAAARTFDELAEATENPEERQRLEAWRLACLANDPEGREDTVGYARQILENAPDHYQAILWAIARGFDVNLELSEVALEKLVDDGSAEYSHVLALASIYLDSGRPRDTVKLLGRTRDIFDGEGVGLLWILWRAQALALDGEPEAALRLVNRSGAGAKLRRTRTVILRALAEKTGNWEELARHLEGAYEQTGNPMFLADRCGLAVQQRDWGYIADRAARLVEEVATDAAVGLATVAAFNSGRYDLCLRLLDGNQSLFSGGRLPEDLRQVRILCHSALGIFPRAVAEAEALANEAPTRENLLSLAQLYQAKGDLKALSIVARRLQDTSDLRSEDCLRLSQSVRLEDSGLAASLWRRAVAGDIPESLVGEAVFLGFQLGLDREVNPLFERMADLARRGEGGVWFVSMADFIPTLQEQRSDLEQILQSYKDGTVPAHIVAERQNWTLSELYHLLPSGNEKKPAPMEQSSLLVRHGGRASLPGFPDELSGQRLNMDITAVLLAAHLEILPTVEEAFGPLRIPADAVQAIMQMADKTTHHQPSKFREYGDIVELAEQGSLRTVDLEPNLKHEAASVEELGEDWISLFKRAREGGGFLLDFFPPSMLGTIDEPAVLPEGAEEHLVNHRSVLETLYLRGQLSEKEYSEAMERLGEQGRQEPSEAVPEAGAALYCLRTTAELLSNAGLLDHACEVFRVFVERRELEDARAAVRFRERSRAHVEWLNGLRDRLRQGIDDRVYETIPLARHEEVEPVRSGPAQLGLRCLETLFRFEAEQRDVIWADDRMVSSCPTRLNVPIIGIDEVLKALVGAGHMMPGDYFDKLTQLRAANARYFPVQKDEILHHLRQTRVENGEVVETRPLRILRRYVAACLAQADYLQRPPMPERAPNRVGEVEFVAGVNREVATALLEVWKTEEDETKCLAWAEWLMSGLYFDLPHLSSFTTDPASDQEEYYTFALGLAGLVFLALDLQLSGEGDGGAGASRSYLDWLQARVLKKRFDADPRLVEAVAEALKSYLTGLYGEAERQSRDPKVGILLRLFCDSLPEPLREWMTIDANFVSDLGDQQVKLVTLDGLAFYPDDFCRAARAAINGRESSVVPFGRNTEIVFMPTEVGSGSHAPRFAHPDTGVDVVLRDQALLVLHDAPAERELTLRRNRHWFDCLDEEFEAAVAEIASAEDPQRRLDLVESWRESSTAMFYTRLPQKLLETSSLSELRPPSIEGLVRCLRLRPDVEPSEPLQEALETAACQLMQEEDLFTAVERLVSLPVPLPEALVEAVAALPVEDRRLLLKRLLKSASSPLSKIHIVRLLTRFSNDSWTYPGIVLQIVSSLASDDSAAEFEAFCALLNWVDSDFDRWPEAKSWAPCVRLALVWTHAHRLHAGFTQIGASINWIRVRDTFAHMARRITTELFERDSEYYFDIAHPRQVERSTFLLMALAYGLGQSPSPWPLGRLMSPSLLLDPSLGHNGLGSFLSGDRGDILVHLLAEQDASKLTRPALMGLAETALNELIDSTPETTAWARLYAVVGDFPPYKELNGRMIEAIWRTDFVALARRDVRSGLFALRVASCQAYHLGDEELRSRLKKDLLKLAEHLATQGDNNASSFQEEDVHRVIESAFHLSIAVPPSTNVFSELADLLSELARIWALTVKPCEEVVQRLVDELPIAQGRHFWPLLVRLRAAR